MAIIRPDQNTGGAGGGAVASVTAADTSIVVGGTAANPTLRTATLDVIAADHPPAAAVAMNAQKLTGLADGVAATDAAAFGQIPAALPPNGAAGGDLTGTYPNPAVAAVNGVAVSGAAASGKALIATGAAAAAWATPPGGELGYDQITVTVPVTGTTESGATTVITCAAHTFDGSPVMVDFFTIWLQPPTGGNIIVGLFESGTLIDKLTQQVVSTGQSGGGSRGGFRFTPSAGSHSYVVKAWVSGTTGGPFVGCGVGGAGNNPPAWVRFTKV